MGALYPPTVMNWDVTAVVISAIALGSSIWSTVTSARQGREQNRLQSQLLKLETDRERDRLIASQRAALTAQMQRRGTSASLVIQNTGQASAREVEIRVNGAPISAYRMIREGNRPIGVLGPGAFVDYPLITYDGMPSTYSVALRWRDGSGQEGSWESVITLAR